jgi:hypothetical protein
MVSLKEEGVKKNISKNDVTAQDTKIMGMQTMANLFVFVLQVGIVLAISILFA